MNPENDLFKGYGIKVNLVNNSFSVVRETLTRIGMPSYKNNTLTQTCHIFHRQGEYAIMHFKELLAFDGKEVALSEEDIQRRDLIASLLEEWKLIEIDEEFESPAKNNMFSLKVISSSEKPNWRFVQKYTLGTRKKVA